MDFLAAIAIAKDASPSSALMLGDFLFCKVSNKINQFVSVRIRISFNKKILCSCTMMTEFIYFNNLFSKTFCVATIPFSPKTSIL